MKVDSKDRSASLFVLYLASFIVVTGFGVIIPFFPIYANDILFECDFWGFTLGIALQIGIITAASKVTEFFLSPAYGELSDTTGRKPLILVGMSVYSVLMAGYSLAFDFLSLFTIRALQGIATAAVWTVGEALVVDLSEEEKKGRNLGLYMFSLLAGLTTGPFVGFGFFFIINSVLHLAVMDSYRLTFLCVASFCVLGSLLVGLFVHDPRAEKIPLMRLYASSVRAMLVKTVKSPIILYKNLSISVDYRDRSIYALYVVALVNGFGAALILPVAALFMEDYYNLDAGSISLVIGIAGLVALFGTIVGGNLSDRYGRKKTVWMPGIAGGAVMMTLGIKTVLGVWLLLVLITLRRFMASIMQPSFRALQSDMIPEEIRGKEFGTVQAMYNLGSIIGPVLGGYLYDLFFMVKIDLGNGLEFIGSGITFVFSGMLAIMASLVILAFVGKKEVMPSDYLAELPG
ncbi:MAG: MFS transporter [Candidatus Odinarchaeota archaeon]